MGLKNHARKVVAAGDGTVYRMKRSAFTSQLRTSHLEESKDPSLYYHLESPVLNGVFCYSNRHTLSCFTDTVGSLRGFRATDRSLLAAR